MFISAALSLRGGVEKVQSALVGKAREHDLAHRSGKIALRARLLRKVADGARALRGAVDRTGERRDQPEQAFHQRRFAAAVLAHHAEVIPRADGKRQMLEQRAVFVAEACVTARKQNIPRSITASLPSKPRNFAASASNRSRPRRSPCARRSASTTAVRCARPVHSLTASATFWLLRSMV